ncbi:MAG TPA: hypothetical protein ENK55_05680 [Actinobacteria bacterium]|nr:hypothetical protein [Actinomycetota bacterium]
MGWEALIAVGRRPWLWAEALRAAAAMAPRRWWLRPPFLPLPDRRLVRWRLETAYGEVRPVAGEDLVAYLRWRRRQRRLRG